MHCSATGVVRSFTTEVASSLWNEPLAPSCPQLPLVANLAGRVFGLNVKGFAVPLCMAVVTASQDVQNM